METVKLTYLQVVSETLPEPYRTITREVIDDSNFRLAPGGREHHHNYRGGLVDHTSEVLGHARDMVRGWGTDRDMLVISVAAILHDRNKIFEYEFVQKDGKEVIIDTSYKKLIYHVPGSWNYFMEQGAKHNIPVDIAAEISHCMLAHHGRKEFGSPVEPATKLAHILHAADMLSMQEGKEAIRLAKQNGTLQ
jgi:3'-5' exoribonuclease